MQSNGSLRLMQKMKSLVDYMECRREVLATQVRNQSVARALLEYRKAMEIATQTLRKNGTQIGLIKDLARGMCAESEFKYEQAQIEYKANLVLMDTAAKELNALQSMNKVVDSI